MSKQSEFGTRVNLLVAGGSRPSAVRTLEVLVADPPSHIKVGVFSHCGVKNLGDEALFAAVVQNVRLRIPAADIIGFTINPKETRERHGIISYPIRQQGRPTVRSATNPSQTQTNHSETPSARRRLRQTLASIPGLRAIFRSGQTLFSRIVDFLREPRFLLQSYKRLNGVNLLLVAGSQQLSDGYGGPWGFPYTLLKWTLLSRCTGTKVAILSVGAGPLNSPISRLLIRWVLNLVSYRSYRDAVSSHLVAEMGVKGNHPVFPDLVYSLQIPTPTFPGAAASPVVVGTNPIPFYDSRYWHISDSARYQDYVHKFANFTEWLAQNGRAVLFFPTQARADVRTIEDIRSSMNGSSKSPYILESKVVETLDDLIAEISRADLVVANRYHGIVLSLVLNKPVLGVAYHEKSRAVLAQLGQDEYAVNISDFKTEDLIERFRALEANAPAIRRRIAEGLAPLRKALNEQYDTVFGLIGVPLARFS